ncbi:MAG: ROK family transcriptional regulator [Bifidobacteriaceae bacterium]|jgi:predicted NBD/HSP70 family sugar kinase|nr:ROK family transcriptional regulator [Bifidobacteriaceae bacterium]
MRGDDAHYEGRLGGAWLRPTAKAHPGHSRAHNRALVLSSLFHAGPLSRAELARSTGLTRVTISDLVAELAGEGFIEDRGARAEARVGKPGNLIDINSDGQIIAVIDLSDIKCARGALITLRGKVLVRASRATAGATGEAMVEHTAALMAELIERLDGGVGDGAALLGIGVAAPGVVRPDGLITYAKDYQWRDLPLSEILRDRLRAGAVGVHHGPGARDGSGGDAGVRNAKRDGIDRGAGAGVGTEDGIGGIGVGNGTEDGIGGVGVGNGTEGGIGGGTRNGAAHGIAEASKAVFVANDANLRALAEFTFAGASARGLMEVSLTDGLGAGILLDGRLLLGPSNAAGEIGHIPAMAGGDPCACGRRGCLETVLNRAVLGGQDGVLDAAILARIGESTAAVLAPIVSAFNLSDLVFADPKGLFTPTVLNAIRAGMEERLLPEIMADLDIRVSELGADAALLGAGALVLAERLGLT